jgi:hypothetical protein
MVEVICQSHDKPNNHLKSNGFIFFIDNNSLLYNFIGCTRHATHLILSCDLQYFLI